MIQEDIETLGNQVNQICNMCMAMGIHKNVYEGQTRLLSHMPVSLYPYEISQETYDKLVKAHLIWAKLILKVSKDKQFVNKVFQKTAGSDAFVKKYLDFYNKFIDKQFFGVACLRNDYMGDEHPELVQFNLMSVGLNGMSDIVQKLATLKKKHRTLDQQAYYPTNSNQIQLLDAIQLTIKSQNLSGIALMVVHQKHLKQFNFGDQNAFQLEALSRQIKVKRVSMTQFISEYRVDENNYLFLSNQKVAVVYFRTAYAPSHYPSEQHWTLRQQIQRANVLSIPSVSMQLINFKRMQVQLSKLDVLRNYLPEDEALLIKSLTGQLYDFEDESQLAHLQALANTGKYILKANRQGGGNNYFKEEAGIKCEQLIKIPGQLQKYILMNNINSQIRDNVFIANYQWSQVKQSTCELSTFGSFAYKMDQLVFNKCGGTLVRLKRAEQNQGGIAVDKAVIAGLCVIKTE